MAGILAYRTKTVSNMPFSTEGRLGRNNPSDNSDALAAIAISLGTTKESLLAFAASGLSVPTGDPYSDFSVVEENSYAYKVVEFLATLLNGGKIDTIALLSFSKWFASWTRLKSALIEEYGYSQTTRDVAYAFDLTKLKPEFIDPAFQSTLDSSIHSVLRAGI